MEGRGVSPVSRGTLSLKISIIFTDHLSPIPGQMSFLLISNPTAHPGGPLSSLKN